MGNIWLMIRRLYIVTTPIIWVILRLWLFLSCFTQVVSGVSSITTRNMSIVWNTFFRVRFRITILRYRRRKYCFPWPSSSKSFVEIFTSISFVVSTPLCVCGNQRILIHKAFYDKQNLNRHFLVKQNIYKKHSEKA